MPPPAAGDPRKSRRRRKRRVLTMLLVGVLAAVGWSAYSALERRQRVQAVPTFEEALPSPASYWMSFEMRGLDGLPTSYRVQRSPASDSIVMETESGFGDMNGTTLLMSAEGIWFFTRQSGAVAPAAAADQAMWERIEAESDLRVFSDIITDRIRPHALLNETVDPSTRTALPGHDFTDVRMTLDFGTFKADDPQGFRAWVSMMGLGVEGEEGTSADAIIPTRSTRETFQLEVTVDQNGVVWHMRLLQDDQLVIEIQLDELSGEAFIPPDPTP